MDRCTQTLYYINSIDVTEIVIATKEAIPYFIMFLIGIGVGTLLKKGRELKKEK